MDTKTSQLISVNSSDNATSTNPDTLFQLSFFISEVPSDGFFGSLEVKAESLLEQGLITKLPSFSSQTADFDPDYSKIIISCPAADTNTWNSFLTGMRFGISHWTYFSGT